MKKITVDLLGNSTTRKKQKRIKFIITFLYVAVWFFSLFALFYIHKTNIFISSIYQKEINKISSELALQYPKIDRIKELYKGKKKIELKEEIYLQNYYRPHNWLKKMVALSNTIPENIRLEKIAVNTNPAKGKGEKMKLIGYTLIDTYKNDPSELNIFKQVLEKQTEFMENFERIDILESRIGKKGNKPIMTFIIGIY